MNSSPLSLSTRSFEADAEGITTDHVVFRLLQDVRA